MNMRMSVGGRLKLRLREGCRLIAYRDSVGVWTIGVGHSSEAGTPPHVHSGMSITEDEADTILMHDLAPREAYLNSLLEREAAQNEFDAMLSLMFNVGNGAFARSRVLKLFNSGAPLSAASAFMDFCHPAELIGRRHDEIKQFLAKN